MISLKNLSDRFAWALTSLLYTWYMVVQDSLSMYWYILVCTLLETWLYEKIQNGMYQYVLT
jgi:hypothetical protein